MTDENIQFAVMRWLNDGNRLSVHSIKQIVEPKLPFHEYKVGTCGVALYKGYPGMWQFRILRLGGKKEMQKWLDSNICSLTADATDKFCEEKAMTEDTDKAAMMAGCSFADKTPKSTENEAMTEDTGTNTKMADRSVAVQTPKSTENEETTVRYNQKCVEHRPENFTPQPAEKNAGYDSSREYLKRGGKKDPSSERLDRLEDDYRSLRRKYRKLEERMSKLEGSPETQTMPVTRPEINELPAAAASTEDDLSEEKILQAVKGVTGGQNVFKNLCLQVFSEDEIINSTRTGKRTIKCMENVKPALSVTKFALLESMILKTVPSMDKAAINKKFQNLQKVLRREKK